MLVFSACLLVVLSCAALMVEAGCPLLCSCPASPPSCPPGVSMVTDGCSCCKVCASQFNQDCSATQPCDHIKGLRCHLGVGGDPARGLCRAQDQGRPCELNGRVYQHGEDFQPGCQHQCSCMDGVVGCMPLCPHQVPLPNWRCANPRLARPPGGCCEQWLCDDANHISEDTPLPHPNRHPDPAGNELLLALAPHRSSAAIPQDWMSLSESHGLITSKCFPQTTDWAPCSATCGMGVSSRVTNSNADCRLVRETRLCQIRQCDLALALPLRKGKKCQRMVRPERPVRIKFAGCSTARRYRPRSCGSCSDGRCCSPSLSRTVRLRFHCPAGDSFTRSIMWIQRCSCSHHHGDSCHRGGPQPPSASPHSDIHTFQH